MLAHPIETLNAIKEVAVALSSLSSEDIAKISEQLGDKVKTTFTTKDGINSIPYGAGYAVGVVASEIVLGKGAGAALKGLEGIGAIKNLLTKLDDFKAIAKVKVAETFSDEAAVLAKQRIRQAMAGPQFYTGAAGAELLKEFTVLAGNKLKNGAMTFKEFMAEATKEFGDGIKGKADDLAKAYREAMQKTGFGNEIVELDIEQTSKMAKMQFQRDTSAAIKHLLEGIQEAESKGKLLEIKAKNLDAYDWLQENPRHKELSFDPANKQFKVQEAKAALEAEKQGILEAPVKRGISPSGNEVGDDFVDGMGIVWDVKDAQGGSQSILDALIKNENVLVDARGISKSEFETLKAEIEANRPQNNKKVKYLR